jgi:CRISPR system Cascade subunit CasE
MYLSRLTLRRTPSARALAALIAPEAPGRAMDAQHRLIWSAFAGDPQAKRDFLWRDMGQGQFMVLSARPPQEAELFEPPEIKPFAPELAPGDQLRFVLRANATRQRKGVGRVDVVMDTLKPVPRSERATRRLELAQEAGRAWLEGQGARAGFALREAAVTAYAVRELPGQGRRRPRFGVIDLEGVIEVTGPGAFLDRYAKGFGRAKAFGCGLMLIARA